MFCHGAVSRAINAIKTGTKWLTVILACPGRADRLCGISLDEPTGNIYGFFFEKQEDRKTTRIKTLIKH
jgi:hypothetical protein